MTRRSAGGVPPGPFKELQAEPQAEPEGLGDSVGHLRSSPKPKILDPIPGLPFPCPSNHHPSITFPSMPLPLPLGIDRGQRRRAAAVATRVFLPLRIEARKTQETPNTGPIRG